MLGRKDGDWCHGEILVRPFVCRINSQWIRAAQRCCAVLSRDWIMSSVVKSESQRNRCSRMYKLEFMQGEVKRQLCSFCMPTHLAFTCITITSRVGLQTPARFVGRGCSVVN